MIAEDCSEVIYMYEIDLDRAKAQFSELIDTALKGEQIIIMKDGTPILKLVRVPKSDEPVILHRRDESSVKPQRQSGSGKGLISMSDDFDEPLDDFSDYM